MNRRFAFIIRQPGDQQIGPSTIFPAVGHMLRLRRNDPDSDRAIWYGPNSYESRSYLEASLHVRLSDTGHTLFQQHFG